MMSRTMLCLTVAALTGSAAPALAQRPERIRPDVRERVAGARPVLYQQGREEQTDRQTKTLKLGSDGELSLANIGGDIVVTRSGGNDATLEIVKTARARTAEEARAMLERVEVSVTERTGRAEVRATYPRGDWRGGPGRGDPGRGDPGRGAEWRDRRNANVSVSYTVAAPAGTRLTVTTISGNVKVADIKGDVSVNSISGDVRIANGGRISEARSVSGGVEVVETQIDGGIEAQSVSGNVLFRKVTARRIEAGSVSGSVTLQDVQCERVEAHSVSGSIEYAGTLARNGRYELNSHSGDVRIAAGQGAGFELEANSFSGSVRSDLPLTGREREASDMPGMPGRGHSLRGVYGDGSAVLSITTFSGNIVLSKR